MRRGHFFSPAGLLLGSLFFALSLTPSLIPRSDIVQGGISGVSLAAGYAVGVLLSWLWFFLGLPLPGRRVRRWLLLISGGVCMFVALAFLFRASHWQNTVHALMGLEAVSGERPFTVSLVALAFFLAILLIAKLFRRTYIFLTQKLERLIPRRVSILLGLVAAFALFWGIINDLLLSAALRTVDSIYQQLDAGMEPELAAPQDPMKAGSAQSLLRWRDMGHQGRRYLALGPTAADIAAVAGEGKEPIRVYVGLNAADTPAERAQLALQELKRVGAFERSLLLLITPTGTGWVDPGAINSVEFLHRGDIASVAAQYSYLPSPIALMTENAYGRESAQALFRAVYGHWRQMPADARPRLYLFGLSLGALNSDRSFDFYDIIDDPFDGALWAGPPFRSDTWRMVTAHRDPGSPAWLPVFRDGAVVRFGNHFGGYDQGGLPWGAFRLAYLQHGSDPIVFFDPRALYRRPDWMEQPRAPDVSPDLHWYPIVTMFQLAADMHAGAAPMGFGHSYAPADYVRAWLALTEPDGWGEVDLRRLRDRLAKFNAK
ncbi:alpha/beta-hydrolase family protein [Microbulbifer thermotolerans]|uniref:alpha/beta hydrolase n=1 Tax=Microbulbifer thermotolerans TaxID=252514 RepID=UPI00224A4E05|nr:alpha/beta-hydrolase family protein [Microbulbifer thermotolerans]MCX2782294.1 alpha/beta-hydrolase family protein [Microbulbifer thermotolerans]MCX2833555.1 alpha/beta-hydrolase family protein [Microbulbifer thermotolerans]